MRSTFYGFEIAKSGLFASQQQLNITGHNVSNVNTVGYSRQRLDLSSTPAPSMNSVFSSSSKIAVGGGVTMVKVDQIRNPFLDTQYRQENSSYNKWSTKEYEFSLIEDIFNTEIANDDSGISAMFSDFYRSIHKLAENPSDKEIRKVVLESALKLTETLNSNYNKLEQQYNDINATIGIVLKETNTIAKTIAELNNQIFSYEMSGAKANDLRDVRNLLLDELSGILPITYSESSEGYFTVNFQGKEFINHAKYNELALSSTKDSVFGNGEVYELYWASDLDDDGNPLIDANTGLPVNPIKVENGSLAAYFDIRDGSSDKDIGIPHVKNLFDELARKITREFNSVHVEGWSIPDNGSLSKQDNKFFADNILALERDADGNIIGYWTNGSDKDDPAQMIAGNPYEDLDAFSTVTAGNITVDESIINNIFNISASSKEIINGADNEQRGNNENALKMVELLNKKNSSGNQDNFDSVYKDILVTVGIEMSYIIRTTKNQSVVLKNVDTQRQSIMGVSLDEELTNVIKYGHSYSAASRVITAIDEQLDTVINKMGLVGR